MTNAAILSTLSQLLRKCRDDPNRFNEVFLGGPSFWCRQREICDSVVRYGTTVVYSGNMLGKDYLFARLILWWLYTRPDSLVIVTGPTQNQIGSIVWKEVRRATRNARVPFAGHVTGAVQASPQQVRVGGDWQALGFSTKSVERASGQHAGELLVLVIEGSGVEEETWEALDSLGAQRMAINGNPIRPDGRFVQLIHQAEKDRADGTPPEIAVNAIRIPSTESPHADLDKSPVGLADRTWLERVYRHYGRDSLWVRSHVKAEIPVVSADTLIPESWLDWAAAQPGRHADDHHPLPGSRRISCDLGEGVGRDSSCIVVRDDRGILEVVSGSYLGLAEAASRIFHLSQTYGIPPTRISYDRVGIGRDFHLHLRRMGLGDALGYAGAGKPLSSDFVNLRTEAAWKLRRRLDSEGADDHRAPYAARAPFVIPPADWWPRMREELKALTYSMVGRKIALLSKEDHCTVLGHSPDLSDALLQSFAW